MVSTDDLLYLLATFGREAPRICATILTLRATITLRVVSTYTVY